MNKPITAAKLLPRVARYGLRTAVQYAALVAARLTLDSFIAGGNIYGKITRHIAQWLRNHVDERVKAALEAVGAPDEIMIWLDPPYLPTITVDDEEVRRLIDEIGKETSLNRQLIAAIKEQLARLVGRPNRE